MNTLLIFFIVVTALAVLIQAGILYGMYLAMRKTSGKVELLAEEVRTKVIPTAQLAHEMITELRPKLLTVADNVSTSTTVLRTQLERLDATLTDIVDRTRLQVIRADEFVNTPWTSWKKPAMPFNVRWFLQSARSAGSCMACRLASKPSSAAAASAMPPPFHKTKCSSRSSGQ